MTEGQLSGFTIGVTADRRWSEQQTLFSRRGASILHGPTIRTDPLASDDQVRDHTEAVIALRPDVVIMMTALGVRSWFEAASAIDLAEPLLDVLGEATIWCRGPKAAGAVIAAGLEVEWMSQHAPDLFTRAASAEFADATLAIQLDGSGTHAGLAALEAAGRAPYEVKVYRYGLPENPEPAKRLVRATADGQLDAVTFTSRPSVANFLAIADDMGLRADVIDAFNASTVPVCVGAVCAAGAMGHGIEAPLVPERFRLGALVQTTTAYLSTLSRTYLLDDIPIEVAGRLLRVAGSPVVLADRERDLLRALQAAEGAVRSKSELLRTVWGTREHDPHVVEVNIARLRRRLGPGGDAIETVFRRGYRWALSPVSP